MYQALAMSHPNPPHPNKRKKKWSDYVIVYLLILWNSIIALHEVSDSGNLVIFVEWRTWHGSWYCNICNSTPCQACCARAWNLLLLACSHFSDWPEELQWGKWTIYSCCMCIIHVNETYGPLFLQAKACASAGIARLKNLNRRTLDVLASRLYFYYSLSYELTGDLAEIRGWVLFC